MYVVIIIKTLQCTRALKNKLKTFFQGNIALTLTIQNVVFASLTWQKARNASLLKKHTAPYLVEFVNQVSNVSFVIVIIARLVCGPMRPCLCVT